MSCEIAQLQVNNLTDIPHMLRVIAGQIESGEYTSDEIRNVVIVVRDECGVKVSSVGVQFDYYYTLATLALAQHDMME